MRKKTKRTRSRNAPAENAALRARIYDLEARNRDLEAQLSQHAAILRNPGIPAEMKPLALVLPGVLARVVECEEPADDGLYLAPVAELAEQAGISEETVLAHLDRFAEHGLIRQETRLVSTRQAKASQPT